MILALLFFGSMPLLAEWGGPPGELLSIERWLYSHLGYLFLLGIALSAAGRISRERDQWTFDSLFILPVERWEIIYSKWLGCLIAAALWLIILPLGATLFVGIANRILNIDSIILVILGFIMLTTTWLILAGLIASLGLWLSAVCQTTLRARLFTFLIVLVFLMAPLDWLVPYSGTGYPQDCAEWVGLIAMHVVTPDRELWTLSLALAGISNPGRGAGLFPKAVASVATLLIYVGAYCHPSVCDLEAASGGERPFAAGSRPVKWRVGSGQVKWGVGSGEWTGGSEAMQLSTPHCPLPTSPENVLTTAATGLQSACGASPYLHESSRFQGCVYVCRISPPANGRRHGFTLIELLVVIAIIGILMMLLLSAIGSVMEAGNRTTCKNNLHQLAIAMQEHVNAWGYYPMGGSLRGAPKFNANGDPYVRTNRQLAGLFRFSPGWMTEQRFFTGLRGKRLTRNHSMRCLLR